jgi:hypothetical protein
METGCARSIVSASEHDLMREEPTTVANLLRCRRKALDIPAGARELLKVIRVPISIEASSAPFPAQNSLAASIFRTAAFWCQQVSSPRTGLEDRISHAFETPCAVFRSDTV